MHACACACMPLTLFMILVPPFGSPESTYIKQLFAIAPKQKDLSTCQQEDD